MNILFCAAAIDLDASVMALEALMRIESDFEATPFLIICPLLALGGRETLRRKTFCYLTWG